MEKIVLKDLKLLMRQRLAHTITSSSSRCFTAHDFSGSREFHATSAKLAIKPYLLADIGEGITECQVINWFVKPGDRVEQFDRICEVQSDKAAVEITSRWDGIIKTLHYATDDMAIVGQPLLDIETSEVEGQEASPNSEECEVFEERSESEVHALQSSPTDQSPPSQPSIPRKMQETNRSLLVPSVRHMLKELNVDIADVQGTGKAGRITKEDVQRHHAHNSTKKATVFSSITATGHSMPLASSSEDRIVPLKVKEMMMFKNMTHSLSIPHFLYTHSVNLRSTNTLRKHLNSSPLYKNNERLTILPFILKALSQALTQMPQLNAHLDTETSPSTPLLLLKGRHHFGIAVDTPQGLLVPVIRNVQEHSIFSLASEIRRLNGLAQSGKLGIEDFKGATFTVSNVGSIGGGVVSPIIVAPQVGIMGIGRIKEVPAFELDSHGKEVLVKKEEVVLSWSADHRVLDGATVARCAEIVGNLVENIGGLTVLLR